MNAALVAAAGVAVLLGGAHSWLGERYILVRLFRREDLPRLFGSADFTKRTLRFAWHLTTVAWWGFAALLVALARATPEPITLIRVIAVTFAVSSVLAFAGSRGRHLSWLVFLVLAALAWGGSGGGPPLP